MIRPILTQDAAPALPAPAALAGEGDPADAQLADASGLTLDLPTMDASSFEPALMGEIDDGGGFAPLEPMGAGAGDLDFGSEDPVERLRSMISERQDETVEILRGWLDEKGEKV